VSQPPDFETLYRANHGPRRVGTRVHHDDEEFVLDVIDRRSGS
jgi:hypothetical protein